MLPKDKIGLIPAAGKGIRLNLPFPKELFPIIQSDKCYPVSRFTLNSILSSDVNHIVFVINESKSQLLQYFGDGHRFNCNISYVVQETHSDSVNNNSTSPGLANALDSAYHLTQGKTVFFGMADTIMKPANAFAIALENIGPNVDIILCLFQTNTPEKFGMVQIDDENQNVRKILDKPHDTDLKWMWGSIIWGPAYTQFLHDRVVQDQISDFASILNMAIQEGLICKAAKIDGGTFIDLGTYDEILSLYSINNNS